MRTILITGGTGLVGKALTKRLTDKNYQVIILTRSLKDVATQKNVTYALWNVGEKQIDLEAVKKADAIIHLAGAGVMDKKWTEEYKQEIRDSRVNSSKLILDSLKNNINKVRVILSASAIGWYGADKKAGYAFTENDPADKAFLGKVKYIGRNAVTYYASYDLETLRGKIKTIGNLAINYFMEYDDINLKGKIKNIGNTTLQYFSSFDNPALRSKLKSVGSTNLNYYTSFDDKAFQGKIKNIGQINFSYYPSFEKQFAGAMKTGNQTQNVAGINYFIQ